MNLTEKDNDILAWHHGKDLINGSSKGIQAEKYLEEYIEYIAGCNEGASPGHVAALVLIMVKGMLKHDRIKTVPAGEGKAARKDAIGDMHIVAVNLAAQDDLTVTECVNSAFDVVSKRKGKMIDGVFVKESDL